ncbi:MAG: hypothetical protein KatS3mg108_2153 [Isosphaeraceae bacterium]|jgi:hypothetical protein|nr:MAG: hypothetical protein KatS3mg108_2153 [Isosphaeraceae bacterium]
MRWCTNRAVALLVITGVGLRLAAYLAHRGYWADEFSLSENLVGVAPFDWTPLKNTQLAPPLYLILERSLIGWWGESRMVARLPSLLAGIASLALMHLLAGQLLRPRAALLALALLALSDEQIYFATELKPYAIDVAVALAIAVMGLKTLAKPPRPLEAAGLILVGGLAIGLSFPAVLALTAVAGAGVVDAARRRDRARLAGWVAAGLVWGLGVAATRAAALRLLGGREDLWRFWEFAFPPGFGTDPGWVVRRVLFLFVSPLDWHGPLDPRWSALPAIGCAGVGLAVLVRSCRLAALVLIGPLGLALIGAALRLYPFHSRTVLFVVPALLILVAAGADWIMERLPTGGRWVLALSLLGYPIALDLGALIEPRQRTGLNPYGDRRPAWMVPDLFGGGVRNGTGEHRTGGRQSPSGEPGEGPGIAKGSRYGMADERACPISAGPLVAESATGGFDAPAGVRGCRRT